MHTKNNRSLLGRMTPWERQMGRFLRSPDGHPDAPAAEGGDAPPSDPPGDDAAAAGGTEPAAGAPAAGGEGAEADAGSPGAGDGDGEEGAADDGDGASGDAPAAEAAPFDGLTAPEGFAALDDEALAAATPILRSLGVETTEQAQKAINDFAPVLSGLVEKAVLAHADKAKQAQVELARTWADETKADPKLGGANYAKTTAASAKVIDTFFGSEFREFLDVTGLGNHPAMVKGMASIHDQIAEGTIHLGDSTNPAKRELHEKLYDPVYQGPQPTT